MNSLTNDQLNLLNDIDLEIYELTKQIEHKEAPIENTVYDNKIKTKTKINFKKEENKFDYTEINNSLKLIKKQK